MGGRQCPTFVRKRRRAARGRFCRLLEETSSSSSAERLIRRWRSVINTIVSILDVVEERRGTYDSVNDSMFSKENDLPRCRNKQRSPLLHQIDRGKSRYQRSLIRENAGGLDSFQRRSRSSFVHYSNSTCFQQSSFEIVDEIF